MANIMSGSFAEIAIFAKEDVTVCCLSGNHYSNERIIFHFDDTPLYPIRFVGYFG
jgi:hypothetical protein